MKKTLLLCGMFVAVSATAAFAGSNLGWDNCRAHGTVVKTSNCNVNTGSNTLVASAEAPAGMDLFTGFSVEMYFNFPGAQPAWWQLRNEGTQTGQCRSGAISASADFTGAPYSSATACVDPFGGNGAGGIGTYRNPPASGRPNAARLLLAFALPAGSEVPLDAGTEYFAARASITNAKTVGTGACAGCTQPVAIELSSVKFVQPAGAPGGDVDVTTPESAGSNYVGWQQPPVSTNRRTWGSVKSLYR